MGIGLRGLKRLKTLLWQLLPLHGRRARLPTSRRRSLFAPPHSSSPLSLGHPGHCAVPPSEVLARVICLHKQLLGARRPGERHSRVETKPPAKTS